MQTTPNIATDPLFGELDYREADAYGGLNGSSLRVSSVSSTSLSA